MANVVVSTPDYVRFATHYGFRPDFCEAADPESEGVVEALCRYAQVDLVVLAEGWADEAQANAAGLKRVKLTKLRAIAPEVLQAAKWSPEELLRTLFKEGGQV